MPEENSSNGSVATRNHLTRNDLLNCVEKAASKHVHNALRLPYKTRSIDVAHTTLRKHIVSIVCSGSRREVLLFLDDTGLRRKLYVCVGEKIAVERKAVQVSDEMSGLQHRVYMPLIVIDECVIYPRWSKSRFIIGSEELDKCWRCLKKML